MDLSDQSPGNIQFLRPVEFRASHDLSQPPVQWTGETGGEHGLAQLGVRHQGRQGRAVAKLLTQFCNRHPGPQVNNKPPVE